MDAASIIRGQLTQTHGFTEQALADLSADELCRRADGAIQSIAAIYLHAAQSEDYLVNASLRGLPLLFERDGWAAKFGCDLPEETGLSDALSAAMPAADMAALRAYAQQVYAATDDYLGGLSDTDLDGTTTFGPVGEMRIGAFLGNVVVWHAIQHSGEICALKGLLGKRGLPF